MDLEIAALNCVEIDYFSQVSDTQLWKFRVLSQTLHMFTTDQCDKKISFIGQSITVFSIFREKCRNENPSTRKMEISIRLPDLFPAC